MEPVAGEAMIRLSSARRSAYLATTARRCSFLAILLFLAMLDRPQIFSPRARMIATAFSTPIRSIV